jgi:hypothetical protein
VPIASPLSETRLFIVSRFVEFLSRFATRFQRFKPREKLEGSQYTYISLVTIYTQVVSVELALRAELKVVPFGGKAAPFWNHFFN